MRTNTNSLPHVAQRVFNTPLLIHRAKLEAILAVVGPRIGLRHADVVLYDDDEPVTSKRSSDDNKQSGPVAVIPVYGTLVKRGDWMNSMSGMTSYESLKTEVAAAMADAQVKVLLFDFDSPGGEAAGLFDFANWLVGQRGMKPMIGISNDMAFSAAYAIASCMDELFVTGVGGVGSIGVYMLHVDVSKADEKSGYAFTYIHSGDNKVSGNPHEPLSKSAEAKMQSEVDRIRDMFVELVAVNRDISAKSVYDTEAALYMGAKAVPLLADGVKSYDEAMAYAMGLASQAVAEPAARRLNAEGETTAQRLNALSFLRANAAMTGHEMEMTYVYDGFKNIGIMAMRDGSLSLNPKIADKFGRISGVLAPYDVLSCDLGGFREMYQVGCFKKSLEVNDPLILAYHDPSKVLGRKSNGTARFWEAADGLHYEADLPDTQDARDLETLIRRGDVRGSSAAFFITRHRWETRNGERVRIVEEAELVEGSPHSFAAYAETTADAGQAAAAAHDELIGVRLRLLQAQTI